LGIKTQSARKNRIGALILNGVSGFFSQRSGTIWSFAWLSRTKKPSSREIASAVSRSGFLSILALVLTSVVGSLAWLMDLQPVSLFEYTHFYH
jgi:hypothetical protein